MNQPHVSTIMPSEFERQNKSDTRLHRSWLLPGRIVWMVLAALSVSLFLLSLSPYAAQLHIVCTSVPSCVIDGGLSAAGVQTLHAFGVSVDSYVWYTVIVTVLDAFVWTLVGLLIFWHRSDDWMALLAALSLVIFNPSLPAGPTASLMQFFPTWAIPVECLDFLGAVLIGLFIYLFPNGRFVPHWMRWTLVPYIVLEIASIFPPLHSAWNAINWPVWLYDLLLLMLVGTAVVSHIYRYRRVSTPRERQQTKWVLFGIVIAIVGLLALDLAPVSFNLQSGLFNVTNYSLYCIVLLAIPLSLGIAMLRSHLWDIDIIINRTLVYGALTACVVALYVLVVLGLGTLLQSRGNLLISLLATGLVAVLFQPLRARLQRAVNRLMYGERDTPYRAISRLGQRLEATLAPNEVLPTIVETVAQALKLPYAAITLKQEGELVTVASYGLPRESLTHIPLVYHSEQIGELLLAPRASGESFTPADRALLDDLARQAGVAAHAVRLTSDLQRLTGELQASRTQLVTTREEERRRLRRDLHDGLGSALTSVTFQLDAASNVLERDPQAARTLLLELKGQTQASIADIRRLVYNLRPPILDEWGLVAALREQVAQYQLNQVQVTVDAPESLPALPAAVEVAAYRIALEGLANVVRHARASTCTICLALRDDALLVEVQDNGEGLPQDYHAGVGISAMRERAAELGGSCVLESMTTGGTRVSARLPGLKE